MSSVSVFLLVIAAIFVIGVVGEVMFGKTGVPDVVWLIVVGLLVGPIGGLVSREALVRIAPYFGALTLVVVLFEGGSRLNLRELSGAAIRSTVLAFSSFTVTVAVVAVASMGAAGVGLLPTGWTWIHGLTLGAILGGSSSVVIMPAMSKAGLSPRIANLVNLESALTDVLCVVVTVACIHVAVSGAADISGAATTLGRGFGIGLGAGLIAGLLGLLFLRMLKNSVYGYPLTLGGLLVVYVIVDEVKGSAALAILTVAVMLGNARSFREAFGLGEDTQLGEGVQAVHSQLAFIIKSFFFTFIGAMLAPPWLLLALGGGLGLLLLAARIPAMAVATLGGGFSRGAKGVVAVTFPRGMAAGVLAMFPFESGMSHTRELPVVVFAAVLCSILFFAVGFPLMRSKLAPEDLATPAAAPQATPGTPEPVAVAAGSALSPAPGAVASGRSPAVDAVLAGPPPAASAVGSSGSGDTSGNA
ncbi:MAG: cation:proton antiporter [Polyangiaceae bacterium]|nr:cation:proton antiporter [Polyangiaceae bacterium]